MRGQGRRIATGVAFAIALASLAACGAESKAPDVTVSDQKIVKALDLRKAGTNYSLAGNTNCLISTKLLNDPSAVAKARAEAKTKALVVEAEAGGYGVIGVPIFPPACGEKAVKALATVKP